MFSLESSTEYKGEIETLNLKRNPLKFGPGYYVDVDGNTWDIYCVRGGKKPFINAREVDNMPRYSTSTHETSSIGGTGSNDGEFIRYRWKPYYFNIVE